MADQVEFLLVQDDPADEILLRDELAAHKVVNRVQVAHSVTTALAYLDGRPPFDEPGSPDVVLLDLNLPGRDGRHVLRRLRSAPSDAAVPVILLTDSPATEQILRTERLPVQGYAGKPVDFECLVAVVKDVQSLGVQFLRAS